MFDEQVFDRKEGDGAVVHTMSALWREPAEARRSSPDAARATAKTSVAGGPIAAGPTALPAGAEAARMRLTAKGRGLVVMLAVLGGVVLGFVGGRADAAPVPVEPATVTAVVERGDTIWGFAAEIVEPGQDPRDVVKAIEQLNGKSTGHLVAGEVIRLPTR